jgi:FkbM family methyltransferase
MLRLSFFISFCLFVHLCLLSVIVGLVSPRIVFLQVVTENYVRHEWEWNRDVFPYSIIDISKISIASYARRHEYDYKLLRIANTDLQGRFPVWVKILGLKKFMAENFDKYDYMVVCDVDLFIMQPQIPFDQKLQQWADLTPFEEIDCFMPQETDVPEAYLVPYGMDEEIRGVNSGFEVWKVNEKTRLIIDKWYNIDTKKFPETAKYLNGGKHEQSLFTYLQSYWTKEYDFQWKEIPCNEANGFPSHWQINIYHGGEEGDHGNHGCSGDFVSHFWEESKRYVMPILLNLLSSQYYSYMLDEIVNKHEVFLQDESLQHPPRDYTMKGSTQVMSQDNYLIPVTINYGFLPTFIYYSFSDYQPLIRNDMMKQCLGFRETERSCQFFAENVVEQASVYRKWLLLDEQRRQKQKQLLDEQQVRAQTNPEAVEGYIRMFSQQRMIPTPHVKYLQSLKDSGFEPKVIYDIGACFLHWTAEVKLLWPDATIILFDALDAAEFLYIESGRPYYVGVLSNEDNKEVTFYQNDIFPGGNSYYREVGGNMKGAFYPLWLGRKRVAMTLDSIVAEKGFPPPDFVKIDVQGAEKDIIQGGVKAIRNAKQLIVEMQHVDYNQNAPQVTETLPYIESLGFKCVAPAFDGSEVDADYGFVRVEDKEVL